MSDEPSRVPHLRVKAPITRSPRHALLSAPAQAALWLLALGLGLQWTPGAERWRLWARPADSINDEGGLLSDADQREGSSVLEAETRFRPELAQVDHEAAPPQGRGPIAERQQADNERVLNAVKVAHAPVPIADPDRSLDAFFAALAATAKREPNSVTRVLYHGDSLVVSDYVTGTLRRALQSEFGDAGHGFVLMADAWPAYFHNDVFRFASRGFEVSRIVGPYIKDGFYGLGGVSFKAPPGVRARFGTVDKGEYGRRVALFQVFYLEQPGGGDITVNLDGAPHGTIHTAGPVPRSRVYEVQTSDGAHQLELVTATGTTRTFGVVLERKVPGVVLDAIGIQGARIRFLDKHDDDHWAAQLQLRRPNLLVFHFGANESGDGFAYPMEEYHRTMSEVLLQAKRAVPGAGCLVLAAMDRARKQGEAVVTHPIIPHIVRVQEAVAREVGCAFWNTFEAMGGTGSMAVWVRRGLGQADMTHPSGWGAQVLGNWLFSALMTEYNAYLTRSALTDESPADSAADTRAITTGIDASKQADTAPPHDPSRAPGSWDVPPPTNDAPPLKQRE